MPPLVRQFPFRRPGLAPRCCAYMLREIDVHHDSPCVWIIARCLVAATFYDPVSFRELVERTEDLCSALRLSYSLQGRDQVTSFRYVQAQAAWIGVSQRRVSCVRVEIRVSSQEPDWILTAKPLQAGMVVPRPILTPDASLARKSRAPPVRVWAAPASSSSGVRGRAGSSRRQGRRDHHADDTRRWGWGERALSPGGRVARRRRDPRRGPASGSRAPRPIS